MTLALSTSVLDAPMLDRLILIVGLSMALTFTCCPLCIAYSSILKIVPLSIDRYCRCVRVRVIIAASVVRKILRRQLS